VVTQPLVSAQARLSQLAEEVQRVARKGDQRLETAQAVRTAAEALLKEATTVSSSRNSVALTSWYPRVV
jgi:hypothetical protein